MGEGGGGGDAADARNNAVGGFPNYNAGQPPNYGRATTSCGSDDDDDDGISASECHRKRVSVNGDEQDNTE